MRHFADTLTADIQHIKIRGVIIIAVLTHHWAKDERFAEAREKLDGNGLAQSKAPGFVSRQTFVALEDPTQITSIVIWETNGLYDNWKSSLERAKAMANAELLWSKSPESQRFNLVS